MTKKKKIVLIIAVIVMLIAMIASAIIVINANRSKDGISDKESEDVETAMAENDSTDSVTGDETTDSKSEGDSQSEAQSTTGKSEDGQSGTGTQSTTEKATGSSQSGTQATTESSSGKSGTQTTTEKRTTETRTTESTGSGTEHQHTWEAQYSTVHHDEEGHYEKVCVQEAYDEPVYETHEFCNYCNKDLTKAGEDVLAHCLTCGPPYPEDHPLHDVYPTQGSSYGAVDVQVGTQHHEAVYEKQWIVDKKAYDEQVLTGYKCTTCGETKK